MSTGRHPITIEPGSARLPRVAKRHAARAAGQSPALPGPPGPSRIPCPVEPGSARLPRVAKRHAAKAAGQSPALPGQTGPSRIPRPVAGLCPASTRDKATCRKGSGAEPRSTRTSWPIEDPAPRRAGLCPASTRGEVTCRKGSGAEPRSTRTSWPIKDPAPGRAGLCPAVTPNETTRSEGTQASEPPGRSATTPAYMSWRHQAYGYSPIRSASPRRTGLARM